MTIMAQKQQAWCHCLEAVAQQRVDVPYLTESLFGQFFLDALCHAKWSTADFELMRPVQKHCA